MELHDLLLDREFLDRPTNPSRARRQFEALQSLAQVFTESPQVVLQKLVEIAVEYCGADSAGISLEEPGPDGNPRFRWVAIAGSFSPYLHGTTPRFFSPCGTCLSTGRPQHYRVTKPYYDFLGVTAEPITDGLLIPWEGDASRGTIWAISHGSRQTFNLDDFKLLHALADFTGISTRLTERERRHREQARLLDLSTDAIIGREFDGRIVHWNRGAERVYGWTAAEALGMDIHQFLQTKFPISLDEIHAELRRSGQWMGELVHSRKTGDRITVLCRKVLDRDDEGRTRILETNTDITERKRIAEALQQSHDQLETQVAQRTSALRQLSADLMRVQDDERRKIARELHDSVGQYLVALKMNLDQTGKISAENDVRLLADSQQLLAECLTETRTISYLLHPPLLDEAGLRSALQVYAEGFSKRSGIEVQLSIDERVGRFSQDVETTIFRAIQESLTNVHRHSGSKKVDIAILVEAGNAIVTVRDYGHGFKATQPQDSRAEPTRGVGLNGLRERVTSVSGTLEIVPAEPGSQLKITLPTAGSSSSIGSL